MQNQTPDFAQKFIIEFTKQLIINSTPKGTIEIKPKGKLPSPEEIKNLAKIQTPPKNKSKNIPSTTYPQQQTIPPKNIPKQITKPPIKKTAKQRLTIPKPFLPPRFQNIMPTVTKREIDLGKLNPIIEDPAVTALECDGPNIPIRVVTGRGMKKNTKIVLNKEEINKIIETFSTITKIPAIEGIYKVAAGNLILLSAISKVIGAKFVIKKIPQNQTPQQSLQGKQMLPQRMIPSKRVLMPPK